MSLNNMNKLPCVFFSSARNDKKDFEITLILILHIYDQDCHPDKMR